MIYMARPTEVLRTYLNQNGMKQERSSFLLGRLSMGLEVITVIKTLEDELVPMLSLQRQELISVLQTLLIDQGIAEEAYEWYEALSLWRLPSFEPASALEESAAVERRLRFLADVAASQGGGLQVARALAEGTRALHGSDQSLVPASDVLDPETLLEVATMPSESDESPSDTDESRAEFLRQSRSRRRTEP